MTQAYFYDAKGHDEEIALADVSVRKLGKQQLLWIDATRNDTASLDHITDLTGLLSEARAAIDDPPKPPRLDNFPTHFQFSVPLPPDTGHDDARIDFLVGTNWLITVRDCDVPFFADFREQDRGESFRGALTPAALAASLLDWHLEAYQTELSDIQLAADDVDNDILSEDEQRPPIFELAKMRRRVSKLRRTLSEHRPIVHGLLRADFSPVAGSPDVVFFKAVERHYKRTEDGLERARETVVGSFELYATRTGQDTNELIKALTIVTVIIGIAGAIAGILGMNFDTPISKTGLTGFFIAIGAMVSVAAALLVLARTRKWI